MYRKLHKIVTIVILMSMVITATAFAQDANPSGPVPVDGGVTAAGRPERLNEGTVSVVVHLNRPSLARAGRGMQPHQRRDHVASTDRLEDRIASQIEALGGTVVGRFKILASGLAVRIDASKVDQIRGLPDVVAVRQVGEYELDLSESVPFIGASDLQAAGLDGSGVNVAVIDSGVDYTHAKLGGPGTPEAYAEAYCGDPALTPNPLDPNCNAHAQPADPAFFPNAKVVGGFDWLGDLWTGANGDVPMPDPNPIDFEGHGTHVADIIAGLEAGGVGPGVAPGANIWAFKACSSLSTACDGLALLLSMEDAMDMDNDPGTFDPVDIVNMSLGSIYGQPDDDLTFFSNEAVELGVIVAAAAGNAGDRPFIVDSPSTAAGTISVAWTSMPSDKLILIDTGGADVYGLHQPWSADHTDPISGPLFYDTTDTGTMLGCSDANGTNPWTGTPLAGQVVLMDRGTCAVSMKVSNAAAAGAVLAIIANNVPQAPYEPPPSFSFGGGDPNIPGYTITLADGNALKETALGTTVTVDPNVFVSLIDSVDAASGRGPRSHDNFIKPDIGAPGASVSAEVGTGDGTTAFGGTSGATPMVAGAAALLKQKYGGQPLPKALSAYGSEMPVWMYKSLLMNTANTEIYLGARELGAPLAPITRIGGGRVDVLKAANAGTVAWDETLAHVDARYRTGSLSFGYHAVTSSFVTKRTVVVANLSGEARSYNLSASFRYPEDENLGVSISVSPSKVSVPAGQTRKFTVQLRIDAQNLQDWIINRGSQGSNGEAFRVQEYDGYITVDGGPDNTVTLPWHVLPKRAASVKPTQQVLNFRGRQTSKTLNLLNAARYQEGSVDVFALVERSPNIYKHVVKSDLPGSCNERTFPDGCNLGIVDLKEVGVRDYALDEETQVLEFGITIHDRPYYASQFPAEFDVYIDADQDGTDDWVVFNYDLGFGTDGRNVTWVADLTTGALAAYFFTESDFNSQNWILPVPAAAVGLAAGQQFNFKVFALDGYFSGAVWDCSPGDCTSTHTYTLGKPKFAVDDLFPTVPPRGQTSLTVSKVPGGDSASPSQIGLLLMYRQAPVERESDVVLLK